MAWHARLSASQTKQWWICPGSLIAVEAFPTERGGSGPHAQLGTCAHKLVEHVLETNEDPEDYRDRIIEITDPDGPDEDTVILGPKAKAPKQAHRVWYIVDDDMIEATTVMVDYVRQRLREFGFITDTKEQIDALIAKGLFALEERTNPLPKRDDTGGTADVTIHDDFSELELIDYKNGMGVYVPVEGNKQLRSYLLGRLIDITDGDPFGAGYELLHYTVVQPRNADARAQSPNGDGVLTETITIQELKEFADGLQLAVERVDECREVARAYESPDMNVESLLKHLFKNSYVSLGEDGSHCTFCDFKAVCPAALDKAGAMAGLDFDDDPEQIEDPSEDMLAQLMPWVPFFDKWLKSIKARTKEKMFAGSEVEGYKIVRGDGKRVLKGIIDGEVVDNETLAGMIAQELSLDRNDIMVSAEPTILTGPKIEKLIKGKGSGEKKKEFSKRFLDYQPGALTIAPIDDRREAVVLDVAEDFDDDLDDEGFAE